MRLLRFSLLGILFTLPLIGVGLAELLLGRSLGVGWQPAYVFGLLLWLGALTVGAKPWRDPDGRGLIALALLALAGQVGLWSLDSMGLAGEEPWSKGLKQCVLLVFLLGVGATPALLLGRSSDPGQELRRWERAASLGLGVAVVLGFFQAAHFLFPLPWGDRLLGWISSNPSYATGSGELYLGHSFSGIPRVRGAAPEPLYLANYLLVALPISIAGLRGQGGWSRWWRALVILGGFACLFLSFSRGAWVGAMVAVALVGLLVWRGSLARPTRRSLLLAGLFLIPLTVIFSFFSALMPWEIPGLVVDRLRQSFAGHDMSNLTRLWAWRAGLAAWWEAPFVGVGWGGFGFHFFRLAPVDAAGAHFGWPVVNSLPLLFLAELGVIGFFLWLRALLPAVLAIPRALRSPISPSDLPGLWLALGIVAALVHGLSFSQWELPHLWLAVGISAALWRERARLA